MEVWVQNYGICTEDMVENIVKEFIDDSYTVLAYYADHFQGAKGIHLPELLLGVDKLLEMRIFSLDRELWIHRSLLNSPFGWRIADDDTLQTKVQELEEEYLRKPEMHKYSSVQILDIDRSYNRYKDGETDQFGSIFVQSTVKGHYSLPISLDDNYIRLNHYVRYDENGVANVVDYRLVEFTPFREEGL